MEDFSLYNFDNIQIKEYNEYWLIEPKSRLDLTFSDSFFQQTIDLISANLKNLIINMEEVPYISSSGIKSILKLKQFLEMRGYKLVLMNILPEVKKIIQISELYNLLPIFNDLESCLNYFKK